MVRKKLLRYVPIIVGGLFVSGAAMGLIVFISTMLDAPAKPKKTIQQISLIKPPPPPPPPKVEKPPEPEMEEKVDVPEPDEAMEEMPDMDDLPPAGDMLGLDADGSAGVDGFGLVGRKGGRDLIGSEDNSHSQYSWYAGVIEQHIYEFLADYEKLKKRKYTVTVKLWTDSNGRIKRVKVFDKDDNAQLESTLKVAIAEIGKLSEIPPTGMPQPIRLKIASR